MFPWYQAVRRRSQWFLIIAIGLAMAGPLAAQEDNRQDQPLAPLVAQMSKKWPQNRSVRIVFHGHSVPAGYFRTPRVQTFDSYPSLVHRGLAERFPTAVINVEVTAIGGEESQRGAARFAEDVLSLKPDLVFIDYGLNDRRLGLETAAESWKSMIGSCQKGDIPVVLLTPTPDQREDILDDETPLAAHAQQIRQLADEHKLLLVDSYAQFQKLAQDGKQIADYMSQVNHPNRAGHEEVARLILELFPAPAQE